MKTIEIDGKEYEVDVEKAKILGVLKEKLEPYPLRPGDVYRMANGTDTCNPFLLVRAVYPPYYIEDRMSDSSYQLLGLGCAANSGAFYRELHTLKEIEEYLRSKEMVFDRNIHGEVCNLVRNGRRW